MKTASTHRNFFRIVLLAAAFFLFSGNVHGEINWKNISPAKGGKSKMVIRVVDDEGNPVEGANVWARFDLPKYMKFTVDEKLSDKDGLATVAGKTYKGIGIGIEKEGYYDTHVVLHFKDEGFDFQDGKWLPYGETRTFVLKKIRNPIPMLCFFDNHMRLPRFGEAVGFDMEYGSFVEPYGDGKVADFYLMHTFEKTETSYYKSMVITFPNALDGAVRFKKDKFSKLLSPYHADPNADYQKELVFYCKGTPDGCEEESLGKEEGLILRTRTKVDPEGNLVSAHYGKITGEVLAGYVGYPEANSFYNIFFNPNENDTNLEWNIRDCHFLKKGKREPD